MLTLGTLGRLRWLACYTWLDWRLLLLLLFLLSCSVLFPFLSFPCQLCPLYCALPTGNRPVFKSFTLPSWVAIQLRSLLLGLAIQLLCVCVSLCVFLCACVCVLACVHACGQMKLVFRLSVELIYWPSSNRSKPKRHYFPFICCLASPFALSRCLLLFCFALALWHLSLFTFVISLGEVWHLEVWQQPP